MLFIRTPPSLVHEILLVDDGSDMEHLLGTGLEEYLAATFPGYPIRVVRLAKREGLMRCRMAGIRQAKADVLTFMDSHIEAGHGWLEPMMHRLYQDANVSNLQLQFACIA